MLVTFPGWHEKDDAEGSEREVKPFPSRSISQTALVALTVASVLTFVSVFWQHISSSTALVMGQSLAYGVVKGHVGTAAMVLGWVSVFLTILATIAILVMILSIKVLAETFAD